MRTLAAAGVPDATFHRLLTSTFADNALALHQDILGEAAAYSFAGWRRPPGAPRTTVIAIADEAPGCLILEVERDWSAAFPGGSGRAVVVLHPAIVNDIGWVVVEDYYTAQHPEVSFTCGR